MVVETAGTWNIYRVLPIDAAPGNRKAEAEKCMPPELAQKISSGEYAGVNGRYITTPSDINVINPVPGQQRIEVRPGDAGLLTMTTCHPQFSNKERMIVHAALVRSEPKKAGSTPKELTEGA